MGTTAPAHYLICNGAEYNISDYPYLAQHFVDQFGSVNYFGGNGTTTFAVPDLRGEFLRGTGTNSHENQGSGDNVGEHQDATIIPNFYYDTQDNNFAIANLISEKVMGIKNQDSDINNGTGRLRFIGFGGSDGSSKISEYTSRPTNTSVLYCIKYEPTYYMNNTFAGFSKTTLFEGEANTAGTTYDLNDSVKNYDIILLKTQFTANNNLNIESMLLNTDDIDMQFANNAFIKTFASGTSAIRYIGFNFSKGYDKLTINSIQNNNSSNSAITKIIGIKSSGNSSSGGSSEGTPTYTDEEIEQMVSDILSDSSTSGNGNYTDEEIREEISNVLGGVS